MIKHLLMAVLHSINGMAGAWRDEEAFRLEAVLALAMIPLAVYLAPDKVSLLLMIGSVMLVLVVELLNTAIEAAVNHTSLEIHPFARKAKDAACAAVFLAAINAGVVWAVILFL